MKKWLFSKFGCLSLSLSVTVTIFNSLTQIPKFDAMTVKAATASHVVISEIYGGGGNSGAAYMNDFIELYNPTGTTINLSGWSIQYASSTGSFNNITNLSGSIEPNKYYLIKEASGSGGTINLPTPDATGTINLSATSGKLALAKITSKVSGSTDTNVVDFVGYGSANDYQTTPAPTLSNTKSAERRDNNGGIVQGMGNGWDTNNNNTDFVATSNVNPQNSLSPAEPQSQTVPPTISNIKSINVTSNSATITWTTDQASSSEVNYGSTTSYGNTAFGANNVTSHSVVLTGLIANTAYHYAVKSINSSNLTSTSNDYTFTTLSGSSGAYNYYFGQLHSHTGYSDGVQTPNDAYVYARNTGHADFMAVTDHSNWFDNDLDWTKSTEWANLKSAANANNVDGQFVAIAGFEMTWSNGTGHMNTFNTDWFESRNNTSMNLQNYYNRIASDTGSISQWNHPGTTFGDFSGFDYYNTQTDQVLKLIEVANGSGPVRGSGYYPSYDYFWKALDKGWHVAPTIGQDNHNGDWITANETRTVALSQNLTRADIFDAFRNRRVYATEDKDIKMSFSVNNNVMGSILSQPAAADAVINVNDADTSDTISKIEILTTGGAVAYSKTFSSNIADWNLSLDPTNKYYYIKVTETDGDLAFSAPIWTGR